MRENSVHGHRSVPRRTNRFHHYQPHIHGIQWHKRQVFARHKTTIAAKWFYFFLSGSIGDHNLPRAVVEFLGSREDAYNIMSPGMIIRFWSFYKHTRTGFIGKTQYNLSNIILYYHPDSPRRGRIDLSCSSLVITRR